MHQPGGFGIERARGLIGKEHGRVLRQLPGEDDPLLLAAGEVAGDMHHPVGEFYLVDEVGSPVDCMLLRVADIIERVEHVLDHPVIAIERERALEHDRGPVHDPGLHAVGLLVPEIDIHRHEIAPALGTFPAGPALHIHEGAAVTGSHVVDDRAFGRRLFNATEEVHEHALPGAAPAR